MKKLFFLFLAATSFLACTENKSIRVTETETTDKYGNTTSQTRIDTLPETETKNKPRPESGARISFSNVHIRTFSDPARPDTFKLVMEGMDILNGKARFTITNAEGKRIYNELIPAPDLEASMVFEMKTPKATPAEREKFIKNRFGTFFDEEQFTTPAIAPNDMYDPAYGDQKAWNAIKNNPKSISFNYLTGKENGKRIAWSDFQKKVMTVGNFGG